jgi:xanthine dehydrogenase molybdopterin-binding subunit B
VTIAAKKLGKPIKMQLDRITDMEMYGKEIVGMHMYTQAQATYIPWHGAFRS